MRTPAILVLLAATVFAAGRVGAAPKKTRKAVSPAEYRQRVAPVSAGELRLRATFCSVSVYYGAASEVEGLSLQVRKAGAADWKDVDAPFYFAETKDYRGSILNLDEDTVYEVRCLQRGRVLQGAQGTVRTWASEVPVARTVVLDPAMVKFPVVIQDQGRPDGWVRYTARRGTVLRRDALGPLIRVEGARYVLLDDLTLVGGAGAGGGYPISVKNAQGVRMRNCDISGWGRTGTVDFTRLARTCTAAGQVVNMDGAIHIGKGASEVVVERCYIHDPLATSCSWYYSHPAGNEAVVLGSPDHSCVIRWCDFVGSDRHRFNDAVEGEGNFHERGGFNRDADIYGNFMIYCNDDCIELDGGQQNVRCFGNRFEGALCGVSVQGCMVSPVYVQDNDVCALGDEQTLAGQWIKVSSFDLRGRRPVAVVADNVFSGRGSFDEKVLAPRGVVERNTRVPPGGAPVSRPDLPRRPLPFVLDRTRLTGVEVRKGTVSPAAQTVALRWTGGDVAASVPFRIRRNDAFDWFAVSPREGTIGPGETVALTVRYDAAKMQDRRFYRGAFLVQTTNGLSRVCSLVAATDFVPPYKAEKPGETAVYADAFRPVDGRPKVMDDPRGRDGRVVASVPEKKGGMLAYAFDIPKDGRYYLFVHGASGRDEPALDAVRHDKPRLAVAVDGAEAALSTQQTKPYMTWTMLTPGQGFGNFVKWYDWKAGRHTVTLSAARGTLLFDGLCATDAPASFEPR